MSARYRITRSFQNHDGDPSITLEESKLIFGAKPEFMYSPVYTVTSPTSTMSIEGDFFLWSYAGKIIPFRHYQGDLYVAVSEEAVLNKMMEVASELRADITEG
ncbi:hypothetical protein [Paenibacillus koleovorans]|uniref:hypothetical protein n=1 Tax=Paenibacillus koleovorans TaxID=121608 RepID=UPI000FDB256E|nr:hypothetical protein [Paenibacillus koleovorans]